jgi:hypothetical protein
MEKLISTPLFTICFAAGELASFHFSDALRAIIVVYASRMI